MKTRRHNFTLIELLVVIGIIAVLAGILLPTLNTVMLKTKITKARTEIKALEIAIKQYESTYGFLPVAASATTVISGCRSISARISSRVGLWSSTSRIFMVTRPPR